MNGHSDAKGKDDKGEAFQGWNSRERGASQGRLDASAHGGDRWTQSGKKRVGRQDKA